MTAGAFRKVAGLIAATAFVSAQVWKQECGEPSLSFSDLLKYFKVFK